MTFASRLFFLLPALTFEALIVDPKKWKFSQLIGILFGLWISVSRPTATGVLDLFDRSTVYFGLIAGLSIGLKLANGVDQGLSAGAATSSAVTSTGGVVFVILLGASFWVRGFLIRQSQRKGYFR